MLTGAPSTVMGSNTVVSQRLDSNQSDAAGLVGLMGADEGERAELAALRRLPRQGRRLEPAPGPAHPRRVQALHPRQGDVRGRHHMRCGGHGGRTGPIRHPGECRSKN